MIQLKTPHEIEQMREACRISAGALAEAGKYMQPGVTTKEIDHAVHKYIVSMGAKPNFLGYAGYPGSACISINNQVIHGHSFQPSCAEGRGHCKRGYRRLLQRLQRR